MSNDPYQHRDLFCNKVKMNNKKRIKIDASIYPGLCLGVSFPMDHYVDMTICILCFGIHFKWRKR